MKVTHTHPDYDNPEQRRQALLDTKRLCTALLLARKEPPVKQST